MVPAASNRQAPTTTKGITVKHVCQHCPNGKRAFATAADAQLQITSDVAKHTAGRWSVNPHTGNDDLPLAFFYCPCASGAWLTTSKDQSPWSVRLTAALASLTAAQLAEITAPMLAKIKAEFAR